MRLKGISNGARGGTECYSVLLSAVHDGGAHRSFKRAAQVERLVERGLEFALQRATENSTFWL